MFSPNSKWFAVAGRAIKDKVLLVPEDHHSLQVVNAANGKVLWKSERDVWGCLAFSPDGKLLVSGDKYTDKFVVWDALEGKQLFVSPVFEKRKGLRSVSALAFSPDGKVLAVTWTRPEDKGRKYVGLYNIADHLQKRKK